MNEFRDAITDVLALYDLGSADDPSLKTDIADAVLAMPEMQAIRAFFLHYDTYENPSTEKGAPPRLACHEMRSMLPQSVIEWVLPPEPDPTRCAEWSSPADGFPARRCTRDAGHDGLHFSAAEKEWG